MAISGHAPYKAQYLSAVRILHVMQSFSAEICTTFVGWDIGALGLHPLRKSVSL